jgi:hypothetical protein
VQFLTLSGATVSIPSVGADFSDAFGAGAGLKIVGCCGFGFVGCGSGCGFVDIFIQNEDR